MVVPMYIFTTISSFWLMVRSVATGPNDTVFFNNNSSKGSVSFGNSSDPTKITVAVPPVVNSKLTNLKTNVGKEVQIAKRRTEDENSEGSGSEQTSSSKNDGEQEEGARQDTPTAKENPDNNNPQNENQETNSSDGSGDYLADGITQEAGDGSEPETRNIIGTINSPQVVLGGSETVSTTKANSDDYNNLAVPALSPSNSKTITLVQQNIQNGNPQALGVTQKNGAKSKPKFVVLVLQFTAVVFVSVMIMILLA